MELSSQPQRQRHASTRFQDYEVYADGDISVEGNLVHMALFVDIEPVSFNQAITETRWIDAMKEELQAIEEQDLGAHATSKRKNCH
jgi:hypothetical protein